MNVDVYGCGPAGLMVAHAAARKGHEVRIISERAEKSRMGGAQYLHTAIPDITSEDPDDFFEYVMTGTRSGYASKVYGDPDAPVSWTKFAEQNRVGTPAWNLFDAYDRLWDMYGDRVVEGKIHGTNWYMMSAAVPLVLSTIPRDIFCKNPQHSFQEQSVWVEPKARRPDVGDLHGDFIHYNGDRATGSWYRSSELFGAGMTEWRDGADDIPDTAFRITKPLRHNCACLSASPRIEFIGRYGAWTKSQLVSDAWRIANEVL